LISNGTAVMQLLEGERRSIPAL